MSYALMRLSLWPGQENTNLRLRSVFFFGHSSSSSRHRNNTSHCRLCSNQKTKFYLYSTINHTNYNQKPSPSLYCKEMTTCQIPRHDHSVSSITFMAHHSMSVLEEYAAHDWVDYPNLQGLPSYSEENHSGSPYSSCLFLDDYGVSGEIGLQHNGSSISPSVYQEAFYNHTPPSATCQLFSGEENYDNFLCTLCANSEAAPSFPEGENQSGSLHSSHSHHDDYKMLQQDQGINPSVNREVTNDRSPSSPTTLQQLDLLVSPITEIIDTLSSILSTQVGKKQKRSERASKSPLPKKRKFDKVKEKNPITDEATGDFDPPTSLKPQKLNRVKFSKFKWKKRGSREIVTAARIVAKYNANDNC